MANQPTALAKVIELVISEKEYANTLYVRSKTAYEENTSLGKVEAYEQVLEFIKNTFPYERETMEHMCILGLSEHDTGAMNDTVKQTTTDYFTQNYTQDGK